MKKEKSLNFLCSKWLMATFFALGILLFSNGDVVAQATPLSSEIAYITNIRNGFAPGTAKYQFAQDALDYFNYLDAGITNNPDFINDLQDQNGTDPFMAAPLRKVHPSILAQYSAAELATFSTYVTQFNAGNGTTPAGNAALVETVANPGDPINALGARKRQWILDANAY